jgi:DNA-binding CsgD family transcriptional regulator
MAASQEALSQEALYTILTKLPFGLMVIDPEGTVLLWNPAAQAILENRFGWKGAEAPDLRSLPWAIQTGVEHLREASRRWGDRSSLASLTLASSDFYLHLFLLPPKGRVQGRGAKNIYVVVVLQSREPSLSDLWESQASLGPREQEVLHWLMRGKTRKEMSIILGLSEATVRTYLERLYAKLGVHNKMEAASIALQQQLIEGLVSTLPPA